jgi:hypothetical protein
MIKKKYACLEKYSYDDGIYQFIPIRINDIEFIRQWRNDQINVLRQQNPISRKDQQQYFEKKIFPMLNQTKPKQILFSILENLNLIGYGGLVNIDWDKKISEISFLIDTDRSKNSLLYKSDFSVFLNLLKKIVCNELKFYKLFTETYDIRPIHINILEKNKFKLLKKQNSGKLVDGKLVDGKLVDGKLVDVLYHYYICDTFDNV